MASIWKHPKSKYWSACFTLPNGRRTKRSTKEVNRKKAQTIAEKWGDAARRKLTEAQARRVLSDIYEKINEKSLPTSTLRDFIARWLTTKNIEVSDLTFSKYAGTVRDFLEFIGPRADQDISSITTADISAFRDNAAKKNTAVTANGKLKIIRVAFKAAWRDGLIADDPAAKTVIIKRREAKIERRPFTLAELKRILEVADQEWKGMLLVGLYTGQRLRDVANLTWYNVDLIRNELRLSTQKTGRRQIIPLAKPLKEWIETRPSSDDPKTPLFPRAFGTLKRGINISTLSHQFYELLVASGLARPRTKKSTGKGRSAKRNVNEISFHCLRHTATSLFKNAEVSEAVAMDIIGHESKIISANYTHIEDEAKRKALDSLPDITE